MRISTFFRTTDTCLISVSLLLDARLTEQPKEPNISKHRVFKTLLRGGRGQTALMSDGKRAFLSDFSIHAVSLQPEVLG